MTRYDERTGEVQNVGPIVVRGGKYRFVRTAPILFSPADPHVLFFATQFLFKTINGGRSWRRSAPTCRGRQRGRAGDARRLRGRRGEGRARGVIYAIAPSPLDVNIIWAGTDDGAIHVTRDGGKTWDDVTPPALTAWSKVSQIDASHFDAATAYASVSRFRLDDLTPHIYRTHDGGKTWTEIARGLATNAPVNVVREDPGARPALRRHRARRLRLVQRRRRLAAAAAEHAGHVDPRSGRPRRRPRRRHARPRLLDPRRHHAAAAARRQPPVPSRRCPLQAAVGLSPAARQLDRHAAAAGGAGRHEPAGRRDHRLRLDGDARAGDARDSSPPAARSSAASRAPTRRSRSTRRRSTCRCTGCGRRRCCRRRRACTGSSGTCAIPRPARCSATSRSRRSPATRRASRSASSPFPGRTSSS